MATRIRYAPSGAGAPASVTFDLSDNSGTDGEAFGADHPDRFDVWPQANLKLTFTRGGGHQAFRLDTMDRARIDVRGIKPENGYLLAHLWSLWAEIRRGLPFDVALDEERSEPLTVSGAHDKAVSTISVTEDPTQAPRYYGPDATAGQRWPVRIEDPAENLEVTRTAIYRADFSPNEVLLARPVGHDLPSGALIYSRDHFPRCVTTQSRCPLRRRPADRGGVWDFALEFRTYRGTDAV